MASGGFWNHEFCPECGKQVEILNEDIQFSMELHLQAHKPLETINHEIEMQYKNTWPQPINSQLSPQECKENSHSSLAIDLQTVIHKTASLDIQSEEKSSTSSKETNKMENLKVISNSTTPSNNLLNDVFGSIPTELKSHQGFISVNGKGELFCNVCKVTIQPIISLNEHLKTKLHEDRTIKFFTDTLPDELHHIMEFVSFYNSRLCCNLCKVNFYFYPDNPNDTMYSIMKHYLSKEHLEKKTTHGLHCNCEESSEILKSFSRLNQVIYNNQQYLEFKMQPEFRCKLCNVVVGYNLNERSLYKSLHEHFISEIHLTSKAASELKAFVALNIISEKMHQFTIVKGRILCLTCNQYVEPNVHELTCHVKQLPSNKTPHTLSSVESEQTMPCPDSTENIQSSLKSPKDSGTLSGRSGEKKSEYLQNVQIPLAQEMKITRFVVEPNVPELLSHTEQLPLNEIIHSLLPKASEEAVPTVSTGKQQPTTHDLMISNHITNDTSVLPGERPGNLESISIIQQQMKSTHTLKPGDHQDLLGLGEQLLHSNMPHKQLPAESRPKKGMSLPASTANNSSTANYKKVPVVSASGKNRPCPIQSMLRSLPQESEYTQCIVEIGEGQVLCLICNCLLSSSKKNIKQHLLGRYHAKEEHYYQIYETKDKCIVEKKNISRIIEYFGLVLKPLEKDLKFIKFVPNETLHCLICSVNISQHANCLIQHLKGYNHKQSKEYYNLI